MFSQSFKGWKSEIQVLAGQFPWVPLSGFGWLLAIQFLPLSHGILSQSVSGLV